MFEKEAEEWLRNNFKFYLREPSIVVAKHAFKGGAEFGYNKANEWHYVKDGDLPKDNRKVFLYTKDRECYMGFFENGAWKYESGFYATDDFVIAWKEIVLPKESE